MAANPQNKRLTGINPLAYLGVEPITPSLLVIDNRAPTQSDNEGFNLASFWLDSVSEDLYILTNKNAGVATWSQLAAGSAGTVSGLTGDNAMNALPNASFVNVFGGANINTSAGGFTLTVSLNDSILLPATTSSFNAGTIEINSHRFLHAYGTRNTFLGTDAGNGTLTVLSATDNTGLGNQTLQDLTTGAANTAVGSKALQHITTGITNTAVGIEALQSATTAIGCTAVGLGALQTTTSDAGCVAIGAGALNLLNGTAGSGSFNTALGAAAGTVLADGGQNCLLGDQVAKVLTLGHKNLILGCLAYSNATGGAGGGVTNIILGFASGSQYLTDESNNILINSAGSTGDNNWLRIGEGNFANGIAPQTSVSINNCYNNFGPQNAFVGEKAGFSQASALGGDSVALGFKALFDNSAQSHLTAIGSQALLTSNTGGDSTAVGYQALTLYNGANPNIAIGSQALSSTVTGGFNTVVGTFALANGTGDRNTAIGHNAGNAIQAGRLNVIVGADSATAITLGSAGNTIVGYGALANATGISSTNIIIGFGSGFNYATTESNNLLINAAGVVGDNLVTRIGFGVGSSLAQTKTFIAGIRGVTTVNADAIAVLIDSAGQLGTVSSSRRGKENIVDMQDDSEFIYDLRPVLFNYISDKTKSLRYGLIAEEVAGVEPNLVVFDEENKPETVKYLDLPILLLNELQKMHRRVAELEARLESLDLL